MSTDTIYHAIGLMSGTSLDGLDITYCRFTLSNGQWSFDILQTQSVDYTKAYQHKLKGAIQYNAIELLQFHNTYGTWLGERVRDFIQNHRITTLDFVASHGHTIHHQPDMGITYQIGSGQHLANTCQQKVICDFRTNDVALDGQGAPLVPIGDQLLFSDYDFCLNLGGISNISFWEDTQRIAFDISPANMLLNYACKPLHKTYDDRGAIAKSGTLNTTLLEQLNTLDYYTQPYPKSLGYEWFVSEIIPILNTTNDSPQNILHTAVHHIATQIATTIKATKKENSTLLITGGGAKNDFLIHTLSQQLQGITTVVVPATDIIDYKEALLFGFLGVLRLRHETNCLSSVTGARKDSSSGVIFLPQ